MLNNLLKKSKNLVSRFYEPGLFGETRIKHALPKFMYDGDYSYMQSEDESFQKKHASENVQTPLMWLKRPGYKQKEIRPISISHFDLMWLKIDGYKSAGNNDSAIAIQQPASNETIYHKMQLLKAKHQFYFCTMTIVILLNVFLLVAIFIPS